MKWAVELCEYSLEYQPRTTIKSQELADFIAEFIGATQGVSFKPNDQLKKPNESDQPEDPNTIDQLEESNADESTPTNQPNKPSTNEASRSGTSVDEDLELTWILFVDGSSNEQRSGARIILIDSSELKLEQLICFSFSASNNKEEYEALLAGLKLVVAIGADRIKAQSDS